MTDMPDFKSMSAQEVREWVKAHEDAILRDTPSILEALLSDGRKSVQAQGEALGRRLARREEEILRLEGLLQHDRRFGMRVCGVDEVGRGPLAGPIVAAAVILPENSPVEEWMHGINDSKKLTKKKREELAEKIRRHAVSYAIAEKSNADIDARGIAWCNHAVFREAVDALSLRPQVVLSDGYPIQGYSGANVAIVKGDGKSAAIACASILAKVHRDQWMETLHDTYPEYGFSSNAGYGSEGHVTALKRLGPTPLHRRSFLQNILGETLE